jgi:hypothetical protein
MEPERNLPRNHRRALSVVARSIEEALGDIESRVLNRTANSRLHQIRQTLDSRQKEALSEAIRELRIALEDFVQQFQLDREHVTETQILRAQFSHIWTLLEDSRPMHLKGYGELPDDVRPVLEEAIARLSVRLERVRSIWLDDE